MFSDFSSFQAELSSAYETISRVVADGFAKLQELLPQLSATDAKTMLFGAAFFGALRENYILTGLSTVLGAVCGQSICDLGCRAIELFIAQSSEVKFAIVAATVIAVAILYFVKALKNIVIAAVGLYTGVVLGRART